MSNLQIRNAGTPDWEISGSIGGLFAALLGGALISALSQPRSKRTIKYKYKTKRKPKKQRQAERNKKTVHVNTSDPFKINALDVDFEEVLDTSLEVSK